MKYDYQTFEIKADFKEEKSPIRALTKTKLENVNAAIFFNSKTAEKRALQNLPEKALPFHHGRTKINPYIYLEFIQKELKKYQPSNETPSEWEEKTGYEFNPSR